MKYIDEYRDGKLARQIAAAIAAEVHPDRSYHLMEFCGGHTHAIFRYGIPDLLPDNVRMVHGPGCPVCVLPVGRIDNAIQLARDQGVTLCTYGDMLRVPGSDRFSLLKAKAQGADIRMVYSSADALQIAQDNPRRTVVFFAIGFETTTPPTAVALKQAQALDLNNFHVFCNHVLTPSAISNILESPQVRELGTVPLDGFIGPAHVSTVIGSRPYEYFAEEYQRPVVIAGFEPLDVLQAIRMLVRQLNEGRAEVENEFSRAVTRDGNLKAQRVVAECFELRRIFEWRGLGMVPIAGCRLSRSSRVGMPSGISIFRNSRSPTIRRANAAPFCAASKSHRIASCSVRCVHRRIPWGRVWSLRRGRVRLIIRMGGIRRVLSDVRLRRY